MQVAIDYLTFTSKIHSYKDFIRRLGLENVSFEERGGYNGWSHRLWYNGVNILFEGREQDDICIDISGNGCRVIEEVSGCTFDWLAMLRELEGDIKSRSVHVSRLDIAGDDRDECLLDFDKMFIYCHHGRYISKAAFNTYTGGSERIIYFGAPSSDRRLRIYDKALEKKLAEHWVRVEMQMRNKNALSFLLNWYQTGDIGRCYSSVLRDYVRFTRTKPEGKNHSRVKTCDWWEDFVGHAAACPQLYLEGSPYTMWHVEQFLKQQAGSSLRLMLEANGGDMSDIMAIIDGSKLNDRQKRLLAKVRGKNTPYYGSKDWN